MDLVQVVLLVIGLLTLGGGVAALGLAALTLSRGLASPETAPRAPAPAEGTGTASVAPSQPAPAAMPAVAGSVAPGPVGEASPEADSSNLRTVAFASRLGERDEGDEDLMVTTVLRSTETGNLDEMLAALDDSEPAMRSRGH